MNIDSDLISKLKECRLFAFTEFSFAENGDPNKTLISRRDCSCNWNSVNGDVSCCNFLSKVLYLGSVIRRMSAVSQKNGSSRFTQPKGFYNLLIRV